MESDLIGRKLGPVEITEFLGMAGITAMYQGFDSRQQRLVVIYLAGRGLPADAVFNARFRREAREIADLHHPNIADLIDFGQAEGGYYMVSQYVDGVTLASLLDQVRAGQRTLEPEDIAFIIRQIAGALDHSHRRGIAHLDLQPQHIILARSGQAIVTGFGLALLNTLAPLAPENEPPGPATTYMAPEQISDPRAAGPSSDLYSLGAILYQMVTGEPPFDANSDIDTVLRSLNETAPDPRFLNPDVPASVAAVILKALARSPADRFGGAMQLATMLERAYARPDMGDAILTARRPRSSLPAAAADSAPAVPQAPVVRRGPATREERREKRRLRAEHNRARRAEQAARRRALRHEFLARWGRTLLVVAILLLMLVALVYLLQTLGVLSIRLALPSLPRRATEAQPTLTPTHTPTATTAPTPTPVPTATPLQPAEGTPVPAVVYEPLEAGASAFRVPDGQAMVFVPAGQFLMGTNDRDRSRSSQPQHPVSLSAYWIDRTEITNAQYRLCVEAGFCEPPRNRLLFDQPTYARYPVTYVDYSSAVAYCLWVAGEAEQVIGLPTEAQWEKAASWDPASQTARTYPWGDEPPSPERLRYNESNVNRPAAPVGSYPAGASAYGVYDMAGNVWEWVADWFDENYYRRTGVSHDPAGPITGSARVTRGGAWTREGRLAASSVRNPVQPQTASNEIGFRCAMADPRPAEDGAIALTPLELTGAFRSLLNAARANPSNDAPTLDSWEASLDDLNQLLTAVNHPGAAALITRMLGDLQTQRESGLISEGLALQLQLGLEWVQTEIAPTSTPALTATP